MVPVKIAHKGGRASFCGTADELIEAGIIMQAGA